MNDLSLDNFALLRVLKSTHGYKLKVDRFGINEREKIFTI